MVLREVLSGLPMSVLFPFAIAFLPNMHIRRFHSTFRGRLKVTSNGWRRYGLPGGENYYKMRSLSETNTFCILVIRQDLRFSCFVKHIFTSISNASQDKKTLSSDKLIRTLFCPVLLYLTNRFLHFLRYMFVIENVA